MSPRGAASGPRDLSRVVGLSAAITAIVFRLESYPADYLFHFQRDVWFAQLFAWGEALVVGGLAWMLALGGLFSLRWLARRGLPARSAQTRRAVSRRPGTPVLVPCLLGLGTAAATLWTWGSLHPLPRLPDGAAYLLQARIFLAGHWTAPPAPIPAFFEQMFVFVAPFTAAKYFPGFSLILAPGLAIGSPALLPILLSGATGALVFVLTRRLIAMPAAYAAWLLWTTRVAEYGNADAYTAEILTGALFLAVWWLIEEWDRNRQLGWLVLLSMAFALGAITRPLTMLAIFLPAAIHLLRRATDRRTIRALGVSAITALPILAIIPVWSYETVGTVWTTPLNRYVAEFMPFDRPLARSPAPLPPLPDDLRRNFARHARDAARNRFADDPGRIVSNRLRIVVGDGFRGWRRLLLPFALAGALSFGRRLGFGLAAACCIFGLYLTYAYPITHTGYYTYEFQPVLLIAAVAGLHAVIAVISAAEGENQEPGTTLRGGALWLLVLAILIVPCAGDLEKRKLDQEGYTKARTVLHEAIQGLPVARAVIFLKFPGGEYQLGCPVENGPFLDRQPIWLVRDLGLRNAELMRIAGGRASYSYDVGTGLLRPLL